MNLNEFIISESQTLLQAMQQLTCYNNDIIVCTNAAGKVTGILTDGDIRRGLVSGVTLDCPVSKAMKREFLLVHEGESRAHVLDMMMARKIRHIPVIDESGVLKSIHFLSHIISHIQRPNIAVIMAGGKGTRLRPITEHCPKPMLKVAGRPILERLVLHLVTHGITKIYIAVNYMGEMIEEFFKDGAAYGCEIHYLREGQILGSGGPVALLPVLPQEPFVVMNGDLVTDIDISAMIDFHVGRNAMATIASKQHITKLSYGVIEKDGDVLKGILEKPTLEHEISVGTYVLSPECISYIPQNENYPITSLFDALMRDSRKICVYETHDDWIDIGQPDDLKKAMGYNG